MAKVATDNRYYTEIATSIRNSTGSTAQFKPSQMAAAIPTEAIPIDVSTAAEMDELLVAANVGKVYRFIGTTDENYTNGDIYIVKEVI